MSTTHRSIIAEEGWPMQLETGWIDSTMTTSNLIEAHESMNYEMVECHENLSVPASTPAVFNYNGPVPDTTAADIERRLEGEDYALIDVYKQGRGGKVFVSGKVYDASANISYKFKITSHAVCIFPDPEIPFSAFARFVRHIEESLDVKLVPDISGNELDD